MSVPATLRTIAPNLKKLSDAELQVWLDLAKNWVSEAAWGSKYSTGLAYLAAHLATVSARGGEGPVTSQSTGSVSRSYATKSGDEELASTSYGATFLSLRKTLVHVVLFSRGCNL